MDQRCRDSGVAQGADRRLLQIVNRRLAWLTAQEGQAAVRQLSKVFGFPRGNPSGLQEAIHTACARSRHCEGLGLQQRPGQAFLQTT